VMVELRERGVDVAEYVPCIHLLTYMRERYGFAEGLCPVAEDIASRTLALPFFPGIEPGDQAYVAETLRSALR
jgi:perosamine synthetase